MTIPPFTPIRSAIFWLFSLLTISLQADLTIERLRCNHLVDPQGIHDVRPRLSWEVRSLARGERQTAYQIMVASSRELLESGVADLWDTGKVASDQTLQIPYSGVALASRVECYWKVRAWDRDGVASGWSPPASWTVGLLEPSDWSAKWMDGELFGTDPPGPGVEVVSASYETVTGSARRDVGSFFEEIPAGSHVIIPITAATFGGTLVEGAAARLKLEVQINGEASTRYFAENSALIFPDDLVQAPPEIISARYEAVNGSGFRDVTSQLVGQAASGSFQLVVDNTQLGPDPTPGILKQLRVRYSRDGEISEAVFPEHATFRYPSDLPESLDIQITRATFEAIDAAGSLEVTRQLNQRASGGPFSVTVNNATFGSDPAFEHLKRLRVEYVWKGSPMVRIIPEGATFRFPDDLKRPSTLPHFRKPFDVSKTVRKATLYATALGLYELRMNGQRVGDHVLAPEWTDYRKRLNYQAYDVTPMVRGGENVLGAQVADGWYSGHIGNGGYQYWGSRPALLAQLEVEYTDGTRQTVVTDGSWKAAPSAILASDFMYGEDYDARKEVVGWDEPEFDDSSWSHNFVRIEEPRPITGQMTEPVRHLMELPAKEVTEPAPGRWTFDLGQNMVGVVRLKVSAAAGTRVTLRHAEMLKEDGTVYTTNLRGAPSVDSYVCRGGGEEVWTPKFAFHGFRYVEVSGLPEKPPLDAVTGLVFATDTRSTGEFSCSDGWINQLQSNIEWGQRGNYLSVPTDCPQRDERLGWLGDAQVFVRTASYNADIAAFFRKWLVDVRDGQTADGSFPNVAPATWPENGSPGWADAGVICPWTIYQAYGDIRLLEENYPAMVAWVEWCRNHSTNSIRDRARGGDFGDWLSIDADTDKELVGTAYYAYSTRLVADAAEALGKDADAATYRSLFETIKAAFIAKYVNLSTGEVASNTQCAYAMALTFDLLPDGLRQAVAQRLRADIEAKGNHLSTGFVGVSYLLPALTDAGMVDTAYDLLFQDTFPSWLFSVKRGATTIWERWDGWTPEDGFQDPIMNSFNHYSLGSCGEWLYRTVAGIGCDPDQVGFKKIIIRPLIGDRLTSARGRFDSVHGTIGSSWRKFENGFVLDVVIPTNTTAQVHVPAEDVAEVRESGLAAADGEGITFLRMEDGAAVFGVESGRYHFSTGVEEPGRDSIFHDAGVEVRVSISTLLQNDGPGALEFVSAGPLSTGGAELRVEDGWIYYDPGSQVVGPDGFSYLVRDASGGVSSRRVSVGIIPDDAPVQEATKVEMLEGGSCRVSFEGAPGRVYRIETSETLDGTHAWNERATVQADGEGRFEFVDPHPLAASRFYRAVFP